MFPLSQARWWSTVLLLGVTGAWGCGRGGAELQGARPALGAGGAQDVSPAVSSGAAPAPSPDAPAPTLAQEAEGPVGPPVDVAGWLSRGPQVQWYGVYMMDRKVGHAEVSLRRSGPGEPGAFAQTTHVKMRVQALGDEVSMGVDEGRWYGAEAPYPLVETTLIERTQLGETKRTARATEEGLRIERSQDGGESQSRIVAATKESLEALWATTPPSLDALRVGDAHAVSVFDWQIEADTQLHVTVRELKRVRRVGVETPVAVLEVRYDAMGLTSRVQVAEGGVVLETSFGPGIVLRLEERDVAIRGIQGLDVLGSGVPVRSPLGPPGSHQKLHLRVTLPPDVDLSSTPNQVSTRGDDSVWDVRLAAVEGAAVKPEEAQAAIVPEVQMDSDHPAIREQATALIQGVDGRRAQIERLVQWVYDSLEKRLATHIPSASGVLTHRVGDCTEHTWLFVALARAAGIPARPLYGLMYLGDEQLSFGYHAWAEVAVEGRWLSVDPTWNQIPADATHLRLGGKSFDVARAIGQVSIEVVDQGLP